jgi:hypothetical protein
MSERWPGGLINQTAPVPSGSYATSTASGVWTLDQQAYWQQQGLWPTAGNFIPYVEDVFSTYLYTGNGSTQTIVNGIDLAGKGGLVWSKDRSSTNYHSLEDTVRGAGIDLSSNSTGGNFPGGGITAFNSNGYNIDSFSRWNQNTLNFVNWTFRKQPKFFDVVTYTGNGGTQVINHNLGSTPGMVIIKRTDTASIVGWVTYHRSVSSPNDNYLLLNNTTAPLSAPAWISPTSTNFTIGNYSDVNASGGTFVAYLFAHNAGGFGTTGTDNVISCGSFTTSSGSGYSSFSVNLGYEPQYVLIKRADSTGNWAIMDVMRSGSGYGFNVQSLESNIPAGVLRPNTSESESTASFNAPYLYIGPTATGFGGGISSSPSATFIYMAIRRPMKVPTDATTVFKTVQDAATNPEFVTNFPVDMSINTNATYGGGRAFAARLIGAAYMRSDRTNAETANSAYTFDFSNGWATGLAADPNYYAWNFSRRPGFFDVVCYTGDGTSNKNISHNLGVTPELIIGKNRNNAANWPVMSSAFPNNQYFAYLNLDNSAADAGVAVWGGNSSTFFTNYLGLNTNAITQVVYLFATCAGVSKVGSYTGTGSTQTINCGFTGGARFVLIKRTDTAGDWYYWDTVRGMVAGNDKSLILNDTSGQVNANSVYTATTGFSLLASPSAPVNTSGASYIFLAIA